MLKNILLVLLTGATIASWVLIGSLNSRIELLNRQNANYSRQLDLQQAEIEKLRKENEGLNAKVKISYKISAIVRAIGIVETNGGKTGVGKSKNNPLSLRGPQGYYSYPTLQAGYLAASRLWQKAYAGLPLDQSLARWKTGDRYNREPATLAYISNVKALL